MCRVLRRRRPNRTSDSVDSASPASAATVAHRLEGASKPGEHLAQGGPRMRRCHRGQAPLACLAGKVTALVPVASSSTYWTTLATGYDDGKAACGQFRPGLRYVPEKRLER
jgi:hypothetical protein